MKDSPTSRIATRSPGPGEIALVLGLPTGLFLASSISWRARNGPVLFNDRRVLATLAIEVILAAFLLPYLARRGWKPLAAAGAPEPRDILRGVLLWFGIMTAVYFTVITLYIGAQSFVAPLLRTRPFIGIVSPPVIVAAALLNAIFEEFLWLGYAITALSTRFGSRMAGAVSILLRVSVHFYQGRLALLAVLPFALVVTWYFVRTSRIWPVVVAHVIVDAIGLSALKGPA